MGEPVYRMAHCLLELTLSNYQFLRSHMPSVMAAGALAYGVDLIWKRAPCADFMAKETGLNVLDASSPIHACIRDLSDVYAQARMSMQAGSPSPVMTKYTTEQRG